MKIQMTVDDLKQLLIQQKRITTERCMQNTSYYNSESTDSVAKTLPINKERFLENGLKSDYPDDFIVLEKYLTK
ncbi:MAG: hypothetical protein EOO20_26550 [Chryseobacterium sp.]|nr:MAG: hypothetical protein EOO20_26550 [Chryseobacterium sp.]